MPDAQSPDHDQRLKVLLKEFFEQFFRCFLGYWADRLDFTDVTFLDKEVFLAPPQGDKRFLDLVARVRLLPGVLPPSPAITELMTLVHVEIESGESVAALRPRMFEYYAQLRRDYNLPVLPVGLYLRVGLDGIGWDEYEEVVWGERVLHFRYAYVGLPALDAAAYVSGEHLLGVALSALMKAPESREAELHAESLKRIARGGDNDKRQFLLTECLEAYAKLNDAQRQELASLMETEAYREAKPLMVTTFERGKLEGKVEGKLEGKLEGQIETLRDTAIKQLEARFSPLPLGTEKRVCELPVDQLQRLMIDLVKVQSFEELKQLK